LSHDLFLEARFELSQDVRLGLVPVVVNGLFNIDIGVHRRQFRQTR
jgi:hypothetical protein